MWIFLIILVVAILVVLVVSHRLGLLRIEKVAVEQQPEDDLALSEEEMPAEGDSFDEDLSLKEKMEQNGLLDDTKEKPEEEVPEKKEDEEERFSMTDRLTDFKTGRGFLVDSQRILKQAAEDGEVYAVAYFDIDRFRFINSLKGMSIGDYVLTRLSQELENIFPEGSRFSRISADHFMVLFPLPDASVLPMFSERLGEVCEQLRSDITTKSGLRICMGIAIADAPSRYDIQLLMHRANIARHCIKFSRSESWKVYEDAMLSSWLYGESAMEDYGENQYDSEFTLYFTPQQNMSMHILSGCEVLTRWNCEETSSTYTLAQEKGNIPTNSSKVIYQACKAMSRWRKAGKSVPQVSVHLPVTEFFKGDLDELLVRCLSEFDIQPVEFAVIVDASVVRMDWTTVSLQMKKISDIGVQTGVDGIDLGYPNLEFLTGMSLNIVKLHRSYAASIKNPERQNAIRQMLANAKSLRTRLIVEGVDSQQQADLLQQFGVTEMQGQFCGMPRNADDFGNGLSERMDKILSRDTLILDDDDMRKGKFHAF